ncbi:transcriptional regulator [Pseudoxanthomonas yeongjuensis]|nr:transcriptional regulator [Pseudoxanthomonas yeongjuensis]
MASMALRIRRCRTLMRISQSELAHRVGVHRSAVTQWERDGGTHPCIDHLAAISIAANVPFDWLATGRGDPTRCPEIEVPAIAFDYAVNEAEAKLLEVIRRLPKRTRKAVCDLVELIAVG